MITFKFSISFQCIKQYFSGDLPEESMRVKWRKDSALNDRGNNGEDLTGGYYDGNFSPYTECVTDLD